MKLLGQIFVVFMLSLALPTMADTVLWYRFDQCGHDGTSATAEQTVENAANPGVLDGRVVLQATSASTGRLPKGVPAFASPLRLVDPAAVLSYEDGDAMHFGKDSIGSNSSGASAAVICDWDDRLDLASLTTEVIFRVPTDIEKWTMAPLVVMTRDPYNAAYSLQVYNGKLFFRMNVKKSDGTVTSASGTITSDVITAEKWHHVALAFDGDSGVCRIYLDKELIKTINFGANSRIDYVKGSEGPLVVAANTQVTGRTFIGDIDEVRVSDTVLTPEQMLTVRPVTTTAPDVLVHLPFDAADADDIVADIAFADAGSLNRAVGPKVSLLVSDTAPKSLALGPSASSKPADTIYDGVRAASGTVNAGAYECLTNANVGAGAAGACLSISDPTLKIPAQSFTLESFVRCEKPLTYVNQSQDSHVLFESQAFKVLIHCKAQQLYLRTINEEGTQKDSPAPTDSPILTDGNWHHVALVYDAASKICSLYCDYGFLVSHDVTLRHDYGTSSSIRVGGSTKNYQTLNGWLDEVRLTARVLGPTQFQNTQHNASSILAWYDFEDDLSVKPLGPPLAPAGETTALTNGGSAGLVARTWGVGLQDAAGDVVREANRSALRIDRAKAYYPRNALIETRSGTVEMFYKGESISGGNNGAWAGVAGLFPTKILPENATGPIPIWQIRYADGNHPLQAFFYLTGGGQASVDYPGSVNYLDNRWHHLAFSYEPADNDTCTHVVLYWDYQKVAEKTVKGSVQPLPSYSSLGFGLSVVEGRLFTGLIDEVRIHGDVVGPSAFLHPKKGGFFIFAR